MIKSKSNTSIDLKTFLKYLFPKHIDINKFTKLKISSNLSWFKHMKLKKTKLTEMRHHSIRTPLPYIKIKQIDANLNRTLHHIYFISISTTKNIFRRPLIVIPAARRNLLSGNLKLHVLLYYTSNVWFLWTSG